MPRGKGEKPSVEDKVSEEALTLVETHGRASLSDWQT